MKISKIKIKNFRSYGNNVQEIEFKPEGGELILLKGSNGAGKTSLQQAIDYTIFGKVAGRRRKTIPNSKLTNRLNGNMTTQLNYVVGNKKFQILRGESPGKLKFWINGHEYDKAGKAKRNDKIESTVGMDFESFKSFISVSVNDFKNFMSLKPDEKRRLLDTLFDLDIINKLNKILNDLKNDNERELVRIQTQIESSENTIEKLEDLIQEIKEQQNTELEKRKQEVKDEMLSKKKTWVALKTKLEKADSKWEELKNEMQQKRDSVNQMKYDRNRIQQDMKLYDQNQCPTCGSDLTQANHLDRKKSMQEKHDKLSEMVQMEIEHLSNLEKKNRKFNNVINEQREKFQELRSLLSIKKREVEEIEKELERATEQAELKNIRNQINEQKTEIEGKQSVKDERLLTKEIHLQMKGMFSEKGIKQNIVREIVKPINQFIKENMQLMDMDYSIELDENFDAKMLVLGQEVDSEELSTGEEKKVNIAIMLAYLKMIRMRSSVNLLFLDEIFSSIDIEGIKLIISILKDFAVKWKINIVLMHHSELDHNQFDRVIHARKKITTYLEDTRINN